MLRAVQQQMAAGPRVPPSGEGTGDGSCHGLDGFFTSWRAFFAEEKGKSQSESECSGSSFPDAQSTA